MTNELVNQQKKPLTLKELAKEDKVKQKFDELLGKKAPGFITSMLAVAQSDTLKDCDPTSIVAAATIAATMDLPINQNFGMAYLVPYKNNKTNKMEAQFQIGYKGLIQLSLRSGQFRFLNAGPVYEGDIKYRNRLTGEIVFNEENMKCINYNNIVGYFAYFQLLNGFEKTEFMTVEQIESHRNRYVPMFNNPNTPKWKIDKSLWTTDFDTMAIKTVLRSLLRTWAPLSIEMQTALEKDFEEPNPVEEQQKETATEEFKMPQRKEKKDEVIDVEATEEQAPTSTNEEDEDCPC